MVRVVCEREEKALTHKIRKLLEVHGFDFSLAGSKTYCSQAFNTLEEGEKQELMAYLTEFANQPFIEYSCFDCEKAFKSRKKFNVKFCCQKCKDSFRQKRLKAERSN
jgi:hypothetical protein